jgi:hypothetical protein
MPEGRALNRRRVAEWKPEQSKVAMRNDLNRMIEDFLSKGGKITDCNDLKPGKLRLAGSERNDLIPDELWE